MARRSVYLAGGAVLLCAFALGAVTLIAAWWSPVVPEAVAVDIARPSRDPADFGVYIALHGSWHAANRDMAEDAAACLP